MAAPNLDGVAKGWESSDRVREHLRTHGCLFAPANRQLVPECTVACGEKNFDVLAPLAKRLRLPNDEVGQVMVPHVAKETFYSN